MYSAEEIQLINQAVPAWKIDTELGLFRESSLPENGIRPFLKHLACQTRKEVELTNGGWAPTRGGVKVKLRISCSDLAKMIDVARSIDAELTAIRAAWLI